MKLQVMSFYNNDARNMHYEPGQIVAVSDAIGMWLMRDAPGSFEGPLPEPEDDPAFDIAADPVDAGRDGPEAAALDEPPADKMVKRPRRKK